MTSGISIGTSASGFLRFRAPGLLCAGFDVPLGMCCEADALAAGAGCNSEMDGGGEGIEDSGERGVMSMEGERCRCVDAGVLGGGDSSGSGGGGKMKWKTRVAI